jgi:5-methylcytosine-specific restriction protein A
MASGAEDEQYFDTESFWESKHHAIAEGDDAGVIQLTDISELAERLRFLGKKDRLPPDFTGQHLQRLRELAPNSASMLESAISNQSPVLQIGRIYNRRDDLHRRFGGQQQGGISTPVEHPFIMLFAGDSGDQYGYRDGWDENGVFLYTGEGQKGDMRFVRGNKSIRDHAQNGKSLELFESLGKGRGYRYVGEFVCSTLDYRRGRDIDGDDRRVIVFHLVPIHEFDNVAVPIELAAPIELLRQRAFSAASPASEAREVDAKRLIYERSEAVRRYVLARANGVCESCDKNAPFRRVDGTPYLEPHHTRRVSDGGPDDPRWVAALCPNCHREIHSGEHGADKNKDLRTRLLEIEGEDQD